MGLFVEHALCNGLDTIVDDIVSHGDKQKIERPLAQPVAFLFVKEMI